MFYPLPHHRASKNKGVSLLLEVMIGLSIFLIGFLFVYGVFPMAQRSLAESRNQLVATSLAKEYMENERHKSLGKVALGEGKIVVTDTRSAEHSVEGRESNIDYEVVVTGDDGPVDGTRTVEVSVSWTYGGLAHNTVLQSVVGESFLK